MKKRKKRILIVLGTFVVLALLVVVVLKNTAFKTMPELQGEPQVGKWYRITPAEAKSSDGSEWHGLLRLGSEDKVIVYFFGGGVCLDEYTAAHPQNLYAVNVKNQDTLAEGGIGSSGKDKPFREWTMSVLPYGTGDFHTGTGEFPYTDTEGNSQILYHNGYRNYQLFMEEALRYIDEPDTLLVTGFSAGGFGASLLADDVIGYFPEAENITVAVDSSLLLYDRWQECAIGNWHAPEEISSRLTGNNIVLDSLTALHEKRGNAVKILFDCSVRDGELAAYQAYIRDGERTVASENGDLFEADLKAMVSGLQENIQGVGIFIWDGLPYNPFNKKLDLTQHTILSTSFTKDLSGDVSIADWIWNAVEGNVESYGLELLR